MAAAAGLLGRVGARSRRGAAAPPLPRGPHGWDVVPARRRVPGSARARVVASYHALAPGRRGPAGTPRRCDALELPAGTLAATGTVEGDTIVCTEVELDELCSSHLALRPHRWTSPDVARAAGPRDVSATPGSPRSSSSTSCSRPSTSRAPAPGSSSPTSVRLPFAFVDDQLLSLQQRRLVEVRGTSGPQPRRLPLRPHRRRARPRPRGARLQPVRRARRRCRWPSTAPGWRSRSIRNVHVTREVVREGFQRDGALRRGARRARPRDQLGQVALPLRRAGQRQDDDRRDDLPACSAATSTCRSRWRSKGRSWWCTIRCTTTRWSEPDPLEQ